MSYSGELPGDEVIVPTLTYIALVNAIARIEATPVFADSLPDIWQIDPKDVANRITPKTKAIVAVHLYGQCCDMNRIMNIARTHGLFVIEDCAEAFVSRYDDCPAALFGDIAVFSFYGNRQSRLAKAEWSFRGTMPCLIAAADYGADSAPNCHYKLLSEVLAILAAIRRASCQRAAAAAEQAARPVLGVTHGRDTRAQILLLDGSPRRWQIVRQLCRNPANTSTGSHGG